MPNPLVIAAESKANEAIPQVPVHSTVIIKV